MEKKILFYGQLFNKKNDWNTRLLELNIKHTKNQVICEFISLNDDVTGKGIGKVCDDSELQEMRRIFNKIKGEFGMPKLNVLYYFCKD